MEKGKQYLTGDWMNQLSITVHHRLTSTYWINETQNTQSTEKEKQAAV